MPDQPSYLYCFRLNFDSGPILFAAHTEEDRYADLPAQQAAAPYVMSRISCSIFAACALSDSRPANQKNMGARRTTLRRVC